SGAYTVSAVDGVATFPNLSVDKVGNYALTAQDVSGQPVPPGVPTTNGLGNIGNPVTSPIFHVRAGSPFKLVLTRTFGSGTTFTAGQPIGDTTLPAAGSYLPGVGADPSTTRCFEVQLQDQAGNLVTGYSSTLTIGMGSDPFG